MATHTPKSAVERDDKFTNSWKENSPDKKWADMTLVEFKAEGQEIADVIDELAALNAHEKTLFIKRDRLIEKHMQSCDYIAREVAADRNFGPDSALYGGFGYVRESERKRGRKAKQPVSG